MGNDYPYVSSVKIGTVKGEINGVKVKVMTQRWDSNHVINFGTDTFSAGSSEIEIQSHHHPWPDKVIGDPDEYAEEAKEVRELARKELENRNLTDVSEWNND